MQYYIDLLELDDGIWILLKLECIPSNVVGLFNAAIKQWRVQTCVT